MDFIYDKTFIIIIKNYFKHLFFLIGIISFNIILLRIVILYFNIIIARYSPITLYDTSMFSEINIFLKQSILVVHEFNFSIITFNIFLSLVPYIFEGLSILFDFFSSNIQVHLLFYYSFIIPFIELF